MMCAWQEVLNILPPRLRGHIDDKGREALQEIRIRLGHPPQLVMQNKSIFLSHPAQKDDILYCLNCASKYSPWTSTGIASGYITAPGGHRIGVCGETTVKNGQVYGFSSPTSICIRVARDFPGIAEGIPVEGQSVLIIGGPGSGKTTLLRDLIRKISCRDRGCVAVVDEKCEIFPSACGQLCFPAGKCTDILSGCSKSQGIDMVLRNMGPSTIAVDEITSDQDTQALLNAGWCGVSLLATAHAGSLMDLNCRTVYAPLVAKKLFDLVVVLKQDKSWTVERMN